MPPTNYPKEFVENRFDFKLGKVASFSLAQIMVI